MDKKELLNWIDVWYEDWYRRTLSIPRNMAEIEPCQKALEEIRRLIEIESEKE